MRLAGYLPTLPALTTYIRLEGGAIPSGMGTLPAETEMQPEGAVPYFIGDYYWGALLFVGGFSGGPDFATQTFAMPGLRPHEWTATSVGVGTLGLRWHPGNVFILSTEVNYAQAQTLVDIEEARSGALTFTLRTPYGPVSNGVAYRTDTNEWFYYLSVGYTF